VALCELLLGKGFQIDTMTAVVKGQDPGKGLAGAQSLHNDYTPPLPAPYAVQSQVMTSVWVCDDWTEAGGCTQVVPESFKLRRPPTDPERSSKTVPLECPKGSIAVWEGATWHRGGIRTIPGDRVTFHTAYCRLSVRPFDSYE